MRLFLNTTRIMSKKHGVLNLNLSDHLHNPFNSQLKKMKTQLPLLKELFLSRSFIT